MISLLFNHGLVEGVAYRPADVTGRAAVEVLRVVDHARRLWPDSRFYVHDELWPAKAARDLPFRTWAAQNASAPDLRDCVRQLLQVCDQGPFLSSLPRDGKDGPAEIVPFPEKASDTVFEVVELGLHHRLAHPDARAWVLSFGNGALVLPDPEWSGKRAEATVTLPNLRNRDEASRQLEDAAASELGSRLDVLERVRVAAPRVHFLDRVPKGIQSAHIDVPPPRLFRALVGLDLFAAAMERGDPPVQAYQDATGVEVSDESATFYQQPNRRRQVEFTIPGETSRTVFGWHAKVGQSTRIHFTWRQGTYAGPDGPVEGLILWVGRIDKHPQ
jgi:hypothetical protein